MRILHQWAIVLGLACFIQAPALAQPAGFVGAPPPSGGNLIFNKKVQEELGLGSEQIEGISAAARKVREKNKDEFAKLKTLEPSERVELLAKVDKEVLKAIGDILKPEQAKRLKQIEFQQLVEQRGPAALLEADVAKELQLTDKQRKRVASVFNQLNKDMVESLQNGALRQIPALRKEAMDEVRKPLNDEQKKKLEALTGKPFAFPGPGARGTPGAPSFGFPGLGASGLALPGSNAARLLLSKPVQKELNLTEDQTKSIQQGLDKLQKRFADKVEAVFKPGPGEKVDPQSAAELSKKVESEVRKEIGAVLEPGQLKRFHQIELQQQGIRALQDKEVVAALKLTEEQKRRVKMLNDDLTSKIQKTMPELEAFGRDRAKTKAALAEGSQAQEKLFREAVEMIPSLLTPDQRKTWEELTGNPFKLDREQFKKPIVPQLPRAPGLSAAVQLVKPAKADKIECVVGSPGRPPSVSRTGGGSAGIHREPGIAPAA
jgi:hypothetical protein